MACIVSMVNRCGSGGQVRDIICDTHRLHVPINSKHTEASFLKNLMDSLHL